MNRLLAVSQDVSQSPSSATMRSAKKPPESWPTAYRPVGETTIWPSMTSATRSVEEDAIEHDWIDGRASEAQPEAQSIAIHRA